MNLIQWTCWICGVAVAVGTCVVLVAMWRTPDARARRGSPGPASSSAMQYLLKIARWGRIAGMALRPFLLLAEITFLITGALAFWGVRQAAQEIQPTVKAYGDMARTVQLLIKPTAQNVNAILLQAGIASGEMAQASIEQRKYWQAVSEHTIDAIGDAQDAIKTWGSVGSTAQAQIDPTFTRFQTLLSSSNDQMVKFGPLLSSSTSLVGHVDGLVGDPAMHDSIVNLRGFTGNVNLFMSDVQHVTHRFAYRPKQSIGRRLFGLVPLAERMAEFGYYTGAWK